MNLLGKLYYVYEVWEEQDLNEITISKDETYALGHSTLLGIFNSLGEAKKFAGTQLKPNTHQQVFRDKKGN